jgi:hypothetical protein
LSLTPSCPDKPGHDEKVVRENISRAFTLKLFLICISRVRGLWSRIQFQNKKMRNGEANMLRAVQTFFALMHKPQSAADD